MRVVINGIAALERKTGVGHYIDSLYRHLVQTAAPGDHVAFYPQGLTSRVIRCAREWVFARTKKGAMTFSGPDGQPRNRLRLPALAANSRDLARSVARTACHKHFRVTCARRGFELYHEPNYIPWPSELPTVATVLDLSVLLHPEWHPADRVRAYERHFFRGMSYCRHFIAISEFTRREMIENLGVAPERITAIHIGVRPRFRPLPDAEVDPVLQELGLPRDYLLYVGTIEPRKNVLTLMRAYRGLPAELRARHPLVLVGGWGWKAKEVSDYFDATGKAAGVVHFGYLPDPYLPALFNGARALVYPSHYEGFGLPPVEMMACGGAVLASTAGALVEVMLDRGCLIEPDDETGWRDAMRRVLTDDDYLAELRADVTEFANRYTWDECARRSWGVYRSVRCG